MPQIGELTTAAKAGHIRSKGERYIWHACIDCGQTSWKRLIYIKNNQHLRCRQCAGIAKRHIAYIDGYAQICLSKTDPFLPMADKRHKVMLHRLIMAKHIGRCLTKDETVHHKNGIKDDNRLENLELISKANHQLRTIFCFRCELKKEIRLLRWQIKELQEQVQNLITKLMGIT